MLGDAFEVRTAASGVGFAGERPDDGLANGRRGAGRSPANPTLLAALLTSEASPSIQNPDFGVDTAKIRNLGLCIGLTAGHTACRNTNSKDTRNQLKLRAGDRISSC